MPPPVPPPCPVPFAVVRSRDVGGAADWSGRRHVACRLASLQVSHRRQSASCVRTPCGSAQVQRALASGGCMREAEPGERPGAAVAQSATERVSERTTCMGRICMCEREAAPRGRPRISHDTGDARINDMVPLLVRRWVSFCYCKSISHLRPPRVFPRKRPRFVGSPPRTLPFHARRWSVEVSQSSSFGPCGARHVQCSQPIEAGPGLVKYAFAIQ